MPNTKWQRENPEKVAEIVELLKGDSRTPYREIGEMYGIGRKDVCDIGLKHGLRRHVQFHKRTVNAPKSLADELREAEEQQKQLEAKIVELKQKQLDASVRFEAEKSGIVRAFGVTAQPFAAHYADWLRWLKLGGPAKLRDFIEAKF